MSDKCIHVNALKGFRDEDSNVKTPSIVNKYLNHSKTAKCTVQRRIKRERVTIKVRLSCTQLTEVHQTELSA